jgi:HPt (histidine-containing phosphotransfer) domain-containing protein
MIGALTAVVSKHSGRYDAAPGRAPERSAAILRASQASDMGTLKRLAHQLKGAGGSYGFPGITEAAAAVEQALEHGLDEPVLRARVEALASLCRRARAA